MNASCQCGTISFRTPLSSPLAIYVCHCRECRKQSSSAFGVSAIFPYFELPPHLQDQVGCFVRTTSTPGKKLRCYFCRACGVRLLHLGVTPRDSQGEGTRRAGIDESEIPDATISVKAGCLDEEAVDWSVVPRRQLWCKRAVVEVLPLSSSSALEDAKKEKTEKTVQKWDEECDENI